MKNECDENSIVIDTKMKIINVKWSLGNIFAVTGRCEMEDNFINCVKFYDGLGNFIHMLKVPSREILACSWEKEGFRLVLAADCYLFFVNLRPTYKWSYFSGLLVFALPSNFKLIEENICNSMSVVFCQMDSNTKQIRNVNNLLQLCAYEQFCVLATSLNNTLTSSSTKDQLKFSKLDQSSIILCNTIGTPVHNINVDLKVEHIAMNSSRVIVADKASFAIWTFTPPSRKFSFNTLDGSNILTNIDDNSLSERQKSSALDNKISITKVSPSGAIGSICVSEKILVIGQETGAFRIYSLSEANILQKFDVNCLPKSIKLNSDSTKLSIVDDHNTLRMYNLGSEREPGKLIDFEKKEVWDFCWSLDHVDSFAVVEKSKLMLYFDFEPDESIESYGYICEYKDLIIQTASIDGLVAEFSFGNEETIVLSQFMKNFETKTLREMNQILTDKGISEAAAFCESAPHPKLWRLLAEASLYQLDFKTAESALVHSRDYKGIRFVNKLSKLPKDEMKKAEVNAYFKRFDEAEKCYLDIDRKDLAINLRKTIQDWHQVINLIKSDSGFSNDTEKREAMIKLADTFVEEHEWSKAAQLYEEAEAWDKLIECYIVLDNFEGLKKILKQIENVAMLLELALIFESSNMCSEAVEAYSKANRLDLAIKCCINLNEWKMAMDLAETNKMADIDNLLSQYASHLVSKQRFIEVIELYRKANKIHDAVTILVKMIQKARKEQSPSPVWLKKIYTLIGLLHIDLSKQARLRNESESLNLLLNFDSSLENFAYIDMKILDVPWKSAEAFHFYLMAHKQLYNGQYFEAMRTSLNLVDYDDYIDVEKIFILIAISSFACKNYYICSKAFLKLESCESIPKEQRVKYTDLAFEIFTQNIPKPLIEDDSSQCPNCGTSLNEWLNSCPRCNLKFAVCIASGQLILKPSLEWTCSRCKHHAFNSAIVKFKNCPLCHQSLGEC